MKQKKISIKGIILGCLVDWAISLGAGLAIGIVTAIVSIIRNGIPENPEIFAKNIMTPTIYGLALVVGSLGTFIGGFVTGKIAKRSELLNAGLMGLLSLLSAIPFMNGPLVYDAVGYGLTIPLAIMGGYLALKKNTSNNRLQAIDAKASQPEP